MEKRIPGVVINLNSDQIPSISFYPPRRTLVSGYGASMEPTLPVWRTMRKLHLQTSSVELSYGSTSSDMGTPDDVVSGWTNRNHGLGPDYVAGDNRPGQRP